MMTDQNNRQIYEPGDVVEYTRKFWALLIHHIPSYPMADIVDNPMIIIDSSITDQADYLMYNVIQGDRRFEVSEDWVELIK